jgi:septal ring factor EnvC (AmiA/AmiB activator)
MKRFLYLTIAAVIVSSSFYWLSLSHAHAQLPAKDSSAAQSTAANAQDVERVNQLVRTQEERNRRVETLLVRQEQLMDKQEAAFARFQKILDTWEKQQKQYQQYLDSLKK